MTYVLGNGETVRRGKLYGWTGRECPRCEGTGEMHGERSSCLACGGTGEEWGLMPEQPTDLPEDTNQP